MIMIEQEQLVVLPVAPLLGLALLVVGKVLLILVHGPFILTNTTILDLKELLLL